jgi:DeoR/GlpR family transcriptional regulator of sugar metabolism
MSASDIIPTHRRREILSRLASAGGVRVSHLATQLAVAEETIRRDLRLLEREGVAIRTHGGAVPARTQDLSHGQPVRTDVAFGVRLNAMAAEKRAIAAEAAKLLEPNHVIALDGSTTAWELARLLPPFPLTVITNSLVIINALANRNDVRILCTGGRLNPALQLFEGVLTTDALKRLNIDRAFFSCRGIDPQRGLSDPSEASATYKTRLIDLAARSILLADHTKFSTRSTVNFAPTQKIHTLITDTGLAASKLVPFTQKGVTCIRVKAGQGDKVTR